MGYTIPMPINYKSQAEWEEARNEIKPPIFPLDRITIEGTINTSGICPICHSTVQRRPFLFGKRYCTNECCYNFINPIVKK
jgi:hypothetical protein